MGGVTVPIPIPLSPSLICFELKFCGWSLQGAAPTASYRVCMF